MSGENGRSTGQIIADIIGKAGRTVTIAGTELHIPVPDGAAAAETRVAVLDLYATIPDEADRDSHKAIDVGYEAASKVVGVCFPGEHPESLDRLILAAGGASSELVIACQELCGLAVPADAADGGQHVDPPT